MPVHVLPVSSWCYVYTTQKANHADMKHSYTGIYSFGDPPPPPPHTHTHTSSAKHQALTAVLVCILVAMVTFVLHAALCFLTRQWAYRAALQTMYNSSGHQQLSPHTKRKRLRKRRPKLVQLPQYSSSSDCSL